MITGFALFLFSGCGEDPWPPLVQEMPEEAPVLSPDEALESFYLPPGYALELVAAEPMVVDPVAIDFDGNGRMWAVEMRSYMPNVQGTGENKPTGRIVVLDDADGDGQMDERTVYLDSLVLPRSLKVMEDGVLVAATPDLWFTRDTDGDLKADTRELVTDDYGNPDSNPEHNANGLLWGMDNWLHNADHEERYRYRNGRFAAASTVDHGQWGISQDDYGRMYLNSNSDPLRMDLLDAHYYRRNPRMMRSRGVYDDLVDDHTVWPVRPTPGINRGYRPDMLREDSTLTRFTAAGSPVVYRGDRLPGEMKGDVFVSEPSGNLVRRFSIAAIGEGEYTAHNPYADEETEFLTSTDERFRPVNFYSAPDGTLYIVDMYRGIIQHRDYVTDYLERQIDRRNLEKPIGHGRIYRIVHESTERDEKPRLRDKTSEELVEVLSHPNGWWRDTAQRLIVERGDTTAAPQLRQLLLSSDDARARLHALWTLDGLGTADRSITARALEDSSPHVRAAAVRISEKWLTDGDPQMTELVRGQIGDEAPEVYRQLAASLGTVPRAQRIDTLTELVLQHGADPVAVDAAISGLRGLELSFLEAMIRRTSDDSEPRLADALEMLAAAVMNSDRPDQRQEMISWLGRDNLRQWQKLALLDGIERFAPEIDEDDPDPEQTELSRKPEGLLAAAQSPDSLIRRRANRLTQRFYWPGKPAKTVEREVEPLSDAEKERFARGRSYYRATCAPCHQENGRGGGSGAVSLVGSRWVLGPPARTVRIIVQGKEGNNLMPPIRSLSDEKVAAILTYIRRTWGNRAGAVDSAFVDSVRQQIEGRDRPWTAPELERLSE
jgi:mono/diheme cytochrome c family protein/glucose/arabinose dehydrogenase